MNPTSDPSPKIVVSKVENVDLKVPKQAEGKKGCCNKPTKLQLQSIFIREILMLSKPYASTEVDRGNLPTKRKSC